MVTARVYSCEVTCSTFKINVLKKYALSLSKIQASSHFLSPFYYPLKFLSEIMITLMIVKWHFSNPLITSIFLVSIPL